LIAFSLEVYDNARMEGENGIPEVPQGKALNITHNFFKVT